ncbi:MAG TPA: glycosyltransferase family 39 protein [Pseudomonadales bacterium]
MNLITAMPARRFELLYPCVALISLVLSAAAVLTDQVINRDGITYLAAADAFRADGVAAVMPHYDWPLFPMLIGLVGEALGISSGAAAHLLQAAFAAATCVMFTALVARLFDDRLITVLGAFVILFLPEFNDLRSDIIREQGYAACVLTALYALLRYLDGRTLRWLAAVAVSVAAATLFRLEGLALAALLPLLALIGSDRPLSHRVREALALYAAVGLALALGIGILLASDAVQQFGPGKLQQVARFVDSLTGPFWEGLTDRARKTQTEIFPNPYDDFGLLAMLGGAAAIALYRLAANLGVVVLVLLAYGYRNADRRQRRLVLAIGAMSLIAPVLFLLDRGFVTSRYLLPASLGLLLLAPAGAAALIDQLWERAAVGRRRALAGVLALMAVALVADSVAEFHTDKHYLKEAGQWLAAHSRPGDAILTNNSVVAYYSQRIDEPRETPPCIDSVDWEEVRYLALVVDTADGDTLPPAARVVAEFRNRNGKKVLILQGPPS